jgi:hypothetical protein
MVRRRCGATVARPPQYRQQSTEWSADMTQPTLLLTAVASLFCGGVDGRFCLCRSDCMCIPLQWSSPACVGVADCGAVAHVCWCCVLPLEGPGILRKCGQFSKESLRQIFTHQEFARQVPLFLQSSRLHFTFRTVAEGAHKHQWLGIHVSLKAPLRSSSPCCDWGAVSHR